MAQKISWLEPAQDAITLVEINKASTLYGAYSVLEEVASTSDGEVKTSANTWITTYTDLAGTRTSWYKIRFYDSSTTLYSDYSDPVTSEELLRLCSVDDVKQTIDTVGRWSSDDIFKMITQIDDMIYIESGTPVHAIWSNVEKLDSTVQRRYYVGEENIYRVDRVFYGTTTKTEIFLDDSYKVNSRYGMIEVLPVASSGVTLDISQDVEIQYVPNIYHKLSLYRTCQALLEQVDATSGGETSKELTVMIRKVDMVETLLMHKVGVQLSSDTKYYDGIYGVNRKKINQNFDKNAYRGEYGWD